jgi:adenylate cyclase class 2
MSQNNQEIEAKFAVRDLLPVEAHLAGLGAVCVVPRQLEFNLRYDAPDGHLSTSGQVLRLRRYDEARITYKGPGIRRDGVLERVEVETTVGDFETARQILEALGYQPIFRYEKYRAIWQFGERQVMLDEMPYGKFIEIEAESAEAVRDLARALGLNPAASIPASYQVLFERIRAARRLGFGEITFANFVGLQIEPGDYQAEFAEMSV